MCRTERDLVINKVMCLHGVSELRSCVKVEVDVQALPPPPPPSIK